GGTAPTGPYSVDHYFKSGLSYTASQQAFTVPSVMAYFLNNNVPVINFSGVKTLAIRYGLPYPPASEPSIGSGGVYNAVSYRRWLAALMIVFLLGLTALVMRSTHIALVANRSSSRSESLEPKV
ncbi:MAG: poly-gamma-glutamate system protein, partial [Pseudomonadales bacterium]|nr:poly-gamma-glutamate system protein [Pseudomonadales bacterium]